MQAELCVCACHTRTWAGVGTDARHIEQPISDKLVLKGDRAEVLAAVDVPRADRDTRRLGVRVLGMTQYHLLNNRWRR